MRYDTHVVTSVTMAVGLTTVTTIPLSVPFMAGILLGSLFPDIDEPNSFIGKRSFGIAKGVNWMFGHRGFTHSLFAVFPLFLFYLFLVNPHLAGWIAGYQAELWAEALFNPSIAWGWLGFSFGYLFHLVGDFFSKSGIPLFSPISSKRYKIPLYITGKPSERVVMILTVFILIGICTHRVGFW